LYLPAPLVKTKVRDINLDGEMETGKGKTNCYVKSMFELNARYPCRLSNQYGDHQEQSCVKT